MPSYVILVLILIVGIGASFYYRNQKAHDHRLKVYLGNSQDKFFTYTINVISVNGEKPHLFTEGFREGFYVNPGENKIVLSFTKARQATFKAKVLETLPEKTLTHEFKAKKYYLITHIAQDNHYYIDESDA